MILKGLAFAIGIVVLLLVAMFVPGISGAAEWLLNPGYALPNWYWGGVPDVVQLGMVFFLNVVFYWLLASSGLWLRATFRNSRR
jgi:hypothetical protein